MKATNSPPGSGLSTSSRMRASRLSLSLWRVVFWLSFKRPASQPPAAGVAALLDFVISGVGEAQHQLLNFSLNSSSLVSNFRLFARTVRGGIEHEIALTDEYGPVTLPFTGATKQTVPERRWNVPASRFSSKLLTRHRLATQSQVAQRLDRLDRSWERERHSGRRLPVANKMNDVASRIASAGAAAKHTTRTRRGRTTKGTEPPGGRGTLIIDTPAKNASARITSFCWVFRKLKPFHFRGSNLEAKGIRNLGGGNVTGSSVRLAWVLIGTLLAATACTAKAGPPSARSRARVGRQASPRLRAADGGGRGRMFLGNPGCFSACEGCD